MTINQEEDPEFEEWGRRRLTGAMLDARRVREARFEEVEFMKSLGVFEPSTRDERMQRTGRAPITTKWIDAEKGSGGNAQVKSRLVAPDFRTKGDGDRVGLFAVMPPLEAKRMLFRMVRKAREHPKSQHKLLVDVKKAHLNGKVKEDEWAYVALPAETGGGVARLWRWLYGMRPAAKAWGEDYSANLVSTGFVRGVAAPTVFHRPESDVRIVVHGDDFTALGPAAGLDELEAHMKGW